MTSISNYIKLRIESIIIETSMTKTFVLSQISGQALQYQSGQFLTLVFQSSEGNEQRRSYSISSSAVLKEPLSITVKYIENGIYSRELIERAKVGDILEAAGVSGLFVLPKNLETINQVFFFAAGSGITPIFSLIKTILHQETQLKISLIYSNQNQESTIFYQQLMSLQKQFSSRFKINFLFSNAPIISEARLSNFMIAAWMQELSVQEKYSTLFYVCGPLEYKDTVIISLLSEGIPKVNIKKENFAHYQAPSKLQPPDTDAHIVSIWIGNEKKQFKVQYPISILEQAKINGLTLPYSCASGQCGSCVATCVSGKVWMQYNEVLTDKELADGLMLPCTSFPIGGDVELSYDF